MIITGRSPTMRHVLRTHRVALDLLFDKINLDPKIKIKYVHTKNQSAHTPDSMITFHHANTRDPRKHIFVSQNSCHRRVMSRSLPHLTLTTSTRSLSPTSTIFPTFSPSHPSPLAHDPCLHCGDPRQSDGSTQIPSLTNYESKGIEHEVLEPRRIELDMTDPNQTQESIMRSFFYWRYGWIWKNWCGDVLRPVTDAFRLWLSGKHCGLGSGRWRITKNAGSIAVYTGVRGSWIFSKTHSFRTTEAVIIQKSGASAQRTQADQSRRESMMSSSSQEAGAYGKPDAMFSTRSNEPGNKFERSIFKFADPSSLGRSRLESNKDHLLSQARSELMKQEHPVGSFNNYIGELQQQVCAQRLELQDAQHGYIESRRKQVRLQEALSLKESSPRYSEPKYARNGRNEESSRTTSWRILSANIKRKSWDNTKAHFSIAGNARSDEFYTVGDCFAVEN